MSDVIRFLETLGSQSALTTAAYEAAVTGLEVDAAQKRALQCRDPEALNDLLGGRALMAMHIATPDGGEEPQEAPDLPGDEDGEEIPDFSKPDARPN